MLIELWKKIKKFRRYLLELRYRKIPNAFDIHEFLVNLVWGGTQPYKVIKISPELNSSLRQHLSSLPTVKLTAQGTKYHVDMGEEVYEKVNKNLVFFDVKKNQLFDEMILEIEKQLTDFCRSPLIPVNLRAWISKPQGDMYGSNEMHTDGLASGHLKAMIYPHGLNENVGQLQIEDKVFTAYPEGVCVIFKNSDISHRGIPGASGDRIAIEITYMRSLFKMNLNYSGIPNDRHLINPFLSYIKRS